MKLTSSVVFEKTAIEDSLQKPLIEPYDPPANREQFWVDYQKGDFRFIARKYGEYCFYKMAKWKFRYWIRRTLGV